MKNTTFITAILLLFTGFIFAQQTYVPDDNFENYLETHDANGITVPVGDPSSMGNGIANDDYVTTANISGVSNLNVNNQNIADMTGIEDFTVLTNFQCVNNQLTSLYLSQNTVLQYLYCFNNQLTSLDVTQNTALLILYCFNNQLTSLNMRNANNDILLNFSATYNPNLTCVEVDDPVYMNTNFANSIDATATYNIHCPLGETYVPDDNFENYLETHQANGSFTFVGDPYSMGNGIANDNYVTTSKINTVTELDIQNKQISDLTGLEDFTALLELDASINNLNTYDFSQNANLQVLKLYACSLSAIDLSSNTNLIELQLFDNQFSNIDVSNLYQLENFDIDNNQLTSLDVSQNTMLQMLTCAENQLTQIDLSQNTALTILSIGHNQISGLDLSNNSLLQELGCEFNSLTQLDVSQNPALERLWCFDNQLTDLDVTANHQLWYLFCHNNQLTTLNVANGNNTAFVYFPCRLANNSASGCPSFQATNNPGLTCVFVDNTSYMNTNWANAIDATATYVATQAECDALAQTYTPDDNFENYLETHDANGNTVPLGDPFSMGNGIANDDYVLTSRINTVTNLDVAYLNIADLTGIEDFTALTNLSCHHNNLTALDVTQNTSLTELYCNNNQITNLDVTQNTALTKLYCYQNQLSALDVSQNTSLTDLRCYNNQLTGLDVTANVTIQILEFGSNAITNIDLTQNSALQSLNCIANQLTGLDVSQNTVLQSVACDNNQLTSLDMRNGNNVNLYNFTAIGNPDLTCVFVDDKAYMNANWANAIDATATYVETQTECNTLATSNTFLEQQIEIYPIPAKENLTVKSEINAKYQIYDYTGKSILKGSIFIGENTIPLQCIKGIYFMEIVSNEASVIKKIIVE